MNKYRLSRIILMELLTYCNKCEMLKILAKYFIIFFVFYSFFYRKMVYFALYIELETSNKDSNELKNIEFLFKLYNNGTWFFLER